MSFSNPAIGLVTALLVGGVAYAAYEHHQADVPEYAVIVAVDPQTELETIRTPRQVCEGDNLSDRQLDAGGNGRELETVDVAVAEGPSGHAIDQRHQEGPVVETIQPICHTVTDTSQRKHVIAYKVTYRYDNELHTIEIAHRPAGNYLQMEDGVAVIPGRVPRSGS